MLFLVLCIVSASGLPKPEPNLPIPLKETVGAWPMFEPLSDEFEGSVLNSKKWFKGDLEGWKGRHPGLFWPANVKVNNGKLELWARHQILNSTYSKMGYQNFTTSAVSGHTLFPLVGYMEVRQKSGTSKISSSFWFRHNQNTPKGKWVTEIDVIESSGPIDNQEKYYGTLFTHTHVVDLPGVNPKNFPQQCSQCTLQEKINVCTRQKLFKPNFHDFSKDYHTFGLRRDGKTLQFFLDGKLYWNATNHCFHQDQRLIFDRETMGNWFGLPSFNVLPDQPYSIDYVRTWVPK